MAITTAPEPAAGEARYRGHADRYDRRTEAFQQWRERLVALLPARPGDTVLDVGCGTGLCLPLLQDKVGPTGTIVGIDASEQMLRLAGEKVTAHGWDNVRLVVSSGRTRADRRARGRRPVLRGARRAAIPSSAEPGLRASASRRRGGGGRREMARTVAAALAGVGPALHAPFVADFTGFDKPWRLLTEFVPDLRVHELALGAGYLAVGHHTPTPR